MNSTLQKATFSLAFMLIAITSAAATNTTLPLMSAGSAVSAGDLFISRQGSDTTDKKVTGTQLKTFMSTAPTLTGASILQNSQIEMGGTTYATASYPTGTNTYFVIDKGGTAADSSTVFRDQGNARAEIGLVSDNNIHFKTITGSYPSETFTDELIINNDGSTIDAYTNVRLNKATGTPTIFVGNDNGSSGAGLELEYDQTNTHADITSIERGNQYRALLLQAAGVQFWMGTSSTTHVADIEVAGDYKGPGVISTGTKFTLTGCTAGTTVGGATAGKFSSGTTGTCTVVITMNGATGLTAPTGWSCWANDQTTPADLIHNTLSTTTTATLSGTTVSGDVINFGCVGY